MSRGTTVPNLNLRKGCFQQMSPEPLFPPHVRKGHFADVAAGTSSCPTCAKALSRCRQEARSLLQLYKGFQPMFSFDCAKAPANVAVGTFIFFQLAQRLLQPMSPCELSFSSLIRAEAFQPMFPREPLYSNLRKGSSSRCATDTPAPGETPPAHPCAAGGHIRSLGNCIETTRKVLNAARHF